MRLIPHIEGTFPQGGVLPFSSSSSSSNAFTTAFDPGSTQPLIDPDLQYSINSMITALQKKIMNIPMRQASTITTTKVAFDIFERVIVEFENL